MPVTEHERHQLFTWFEEHMGSQRAATLMSLLPPVGWGDIATRRDLEEQISGIRRDGESLRHDLESLRHDLESLRHEVETFRHDVRRDLRELEQRLDDRIGLKLDSKLGQFRSDLLRTFGTWLFASQAAVIAAVGLLVALD
jgi:chromosome segregation ATPase